MTYIWGKHVSVIRDIVQNFQRPIWDEKRYIHRKKCYGLGITLIILLDLHNPHNTTSIILDYLISYHLICGEGYVCH
jgi:hypothetical protein